MTEFFASPDDLGEIRSSELQSSLSERLGAEAKNALDPQSSMSAMQIVRRLRTAAAGGEGAGFAPPVDMAYPLDLDTTAQDAAKAAIPETPIEDAKARVKQEGLEGKLPLPDQPAIKSPVLDLMIQEAHERADREAAIARHPGFVGDALGLATSLVAGMIDPVNLAAFSIPVLGEARMGKMMLNAGDSILARTGARLMQGAAQGAVGAAVLQPADWWLHTHDGRDYTMADALHSVLMSAGMGAAFHSAIGGAGDVRARIKGRPLTGSPADLVARGLLAEPGTLTQRAAPDAQPLEEVPGISPAPAAASEVAPRAMPELEQSVHGDVLEQLRAAGVSEEEAQANAAVVAARYATRAQRLGLDPDKALELYKSEGLEIQPGEEGSAGEGRSFAQRGRSPDADQMMMPGMEPVSLADLARRRAGEPLRPGVEQKPADFGLFGDTAGQADLVDQAGKPEPAAKAAPAETPAEAAAAPEAKAAPEIPQGPYSLEEHKSVANRIAKGEIGADELKTHFARASAAEDQIKAELSKRTIKELAPRGAGGMTKGRLVDAIYDQMLERFNAKGSFEWSPFSETRKAALDRVIAKVTDEDIKNAAAKRAEHIAQMKQTYTDPQTLDDFRAFIRTRGEDKLTPEQRARYDELVAGDNRAQAERDAAKAAVVKKVDAEGVGMELVETKHTQKGHDLFVVRLGQRVEADLYKEFNSAAKQLGGYYSSYSRDGAVPGFQFKSKEAAEKFMAIRDGNVSRADQMAAREADHKDNAVDRLRAMADRLAGGADEKLNADRKVNTARRARMAASSEASAAADKALAATMRNIADAIESGEAKHLDWIRNRTDIEALDRVLRSSRRDWVEAQKPASYGDRERLEQTPVSPEMVEQARYPYPYAHRELAEGLARAVENIPGAKMAARRLLADAAAAGKRGEWQVRAEHLGSMDTLRTVAEAAAKLDRERYTAESVLDTFNDYNRLKRIGINDLPSLRAALREYLKFRGSQVKADPIKAAERALIGSKIPGYFPTPDRIVDQMIEAADIRPGMTVLEPSAGKGNIADKLAAHADEGAVSVIEPHSSLRNVLQMKGHNIVDSDFLEHQGEYDRIVMNPPFEDRQDVAHLQHAYSMLKPGGRVVAIMSEGPYFGSDKRATEFREWLDRVGGVAEKLPEGSFVDSERSTGVATRMVVIDKPDAHGIGAARSYDQATGAPVFYSAAERAIEASKQEKAPADQWLGMLRNATGVKPEEMEWLGLADWLKEQKGSISKQSIADYVRANQIKVEEVQKGAPKPDSDRLEELRENKSRTPDEENEFWRLVDDANNEATDGVSPPKFATWQLPGGENYRELLLTLPETRDTAALRAKDARYKALDDQFVAWAKNEAPALTPAELAERKQLQEELSRAQSGTDTFRGPHWAEPNVLAHVRFNDRTIDGKRALFLEEIQSDWHQQGKRKGYTGDVKPESFKLERAFGVGPDGRKVWEFSNQEGVHLGYGDTAEEAAQQLAAVKNKSGLMVPDAPFKTTWPELALKRMIRYAAENGYEHVAWTPGELQAGRYDLSKQVDRIGWARRKDGTYDLTIDMGDHRPAIIRDGQTASQLEDLIGKDPVSRIEADAGEKSPVSEYSAIGELKGDGLKVGGEGMKGFYDKILPAAANKLVKKFGAKVEATQIEGTGESVMRYDGPEPTNEQLAAVKEAIDARPTDQRFVSPVTGQRVEYQINRVTNDRAFRDVTHRMVADHMSFQRAMSLEGHDHLAELFGGKMVEDKEVKSTPAHSIEITPELRKAAIEEGFPLFQGAGEGAPRGRITLNDNRAVVQLFKDANASTFMHEAGHLWLDELVRDAAHPNAPIGLGTDLRTVLSWLGVDKPEDIGVAQHEQWARGFEQYLAEGRAPSSALSAAFAKFKAWLTAIYRNLTELGRPIPDEIRGVMDRMLATDEEIAAAPGRHPAEILADLPPRAQEDVVRAAIADMIEDRPVRASELLKAAATVDPRIAESLNGPPAEEPPLATVHMGPKAARGPRAKDPEHYSLLEFLAARGGLKPNAELATVFGGKPKFVPGFGPLLRQAGMTLDHAREATVEAGYITDAGAIAGREGDSTINHLLELLDQEARGSKVYRGDRAPPETKAQAAARDEERQAHYDNEFATALDEAGIDRKSVPDKTWGRVLEIMGKEHVSDPLIAYEQAVMEESHYGQEVGQGGRTEQHIAGWDVPDDAGAAPGGRGAAAAERSAGSGAAAPQFGAGDRAADWRALADSRRAVDDPDAIAESKEAAATPEPASIDPTKTVSAAEAAAKQADELWKEIEPTLSEHERDQFNEVLQNLDREKADRESIIREGAACLAAAVA